MRPLPGDDARASRSRSTSFDNDMTPMAARRDTPQMTYFITDEKTMEASQPSSANSFPKPKDVSNASSYGVESLETTISSLARETDQTEEKVRNARRNWKNSFGQQLSRKCETDLDEPISPLWESSADVSRNVSPSHHRRLSQATHSRPFTPLSFNSPAPPSVISSPDSRRNSDAGSYLDEIASQAIMSSGEEEKDPDTEPADNKNAPQLVMPSIKMPSRRPFTEKGKGLGRLKVLVAGDSGETQTHSL